MNFVVFLVILVLFFHPSCSDSSRVENDKKDIQIEIKDYIQLVPSDYIPLDVNNSNNNLDVIEYKGRFYLAFRTAPSHFASDKTELYVVSREKNENIREEWVFEKRITMGTDLREPRFFVIGDRLFLLFAQLGNDPTRFEPSGTYYIYKDNNAWSEPERSTLPVDFIPWRVRFTDYRSDSFVLLSGYSGGENIYDIDHSAGVDLMFLKTYDGINWEKLFSLRSGCSETDFAKISDNGFVFVCRNELGDQDGFGSKICLVEDWKIKRCEIDKRKYDSPLLFTFKDRVYLVGRRNVSENGYYDLAEGNSHQERFLKNQLDYWQKPKRCSFWEVNKDSLTVQFIKDLPSNGDTCFPSILWIKNNLIWLFNYSSDINAEDLSWIQGQTGKTYIYLFSILLQ
ncbi:MAG: hypothetical protein NZ927_03105 [Candidatus Calescibacterium sp.]|nr:hypothetical protein [Candidatus Calescibacterium sp.]MDW8086455.1 hypothetical protein [Candidatus Calescibacterium sp.]